MKLEIYPPPGKPSSPPRWEDIERLALHYAVVHRAVSLVRRGELTREEALIHVAFALAGAFQQLFQGEVERRMMEVAPMIIVKPPSSPFEVSPFEVSPWEEQAQATIANQAADLFEARSERQREHELRVRVQGDAERFEHQAQADLAALAAAQERIKTLVIYCDSASEMLGREAGKVVTLRAELADAQRERYVTGKARDDQDEEACKMAKLLDDARARAAAAETGLRYILSRNYTGAASIAQDVLSGKELPDDEYRTAAIAWQRQL